MKKNLLFTTLLAIPMLVVSCGNKGGGTKQKPEAPVDQMSMTLENFKYDATHPEPVITGLEEAQDVEILYSVFKNGSPVCDYVVGAQNTIAEGEYNLVANISTSTYRNPFQLETTFEIYLADMPEDLDMVAVDYDYDEIKPEPYSYNVLPGTEMTYKYYAVSSNKFDYVPGEQNDIVPGSYTLEVTYSLAHYNSVVKRYDFVVSKASFDDAYALVSNTIDIGELDREYDLDSVNLNSLLDIKRAADDSVVDGVTFSWKLDYSRQLVGGQPLNAKVIAHKQYFNDKEFDIVVNSTKKKIAIPVPSKTGNVGAYTGNPYEITIEGFDENYMSYVAGSVSLATNAGNYFIEVKLRFPEYVCWSDGTTENKRFEWSISRRNPAGSSYGFRLHIGDFIGGSSQVRLDIAQELLVGTLALQLDFSFDEGYWTKYAGVEFVLDNVSQEYASITGNELTINDFDHRIGLNTIIDTQNETFNQHWEIVPHGDPRTISLTPDYKTNTYYGVDELGVIYGTGAQVGNDYSVVMGKGNGSWFYLSRTFKKVTAVKYRIHNNTYWVATTISVVLSKTTDESIDTNAGDYVITSNLPNAQETSEFIVCDFSDVEFDGTTEWYIKFNLTNSGSNLKSIQEIVVEYCNSVD